MERSDVAAPRLPQQLAETALEMWQIYDEADFRRILVSKADLSGGAGRHVAVRESTFERCKFAEADLPHLHFADTTFTDCDFVNAAALEASWQRVQFIRCRMTGVQPGQAYLKDVLFEKCRIDLANFRYSELHNSLFIGCTLKGADFEGCGFKNCHFADCELEDAIFKDCKIDGLDLRTSVIVEALGITFLKGATIDAGQAVELAPALARAAGLLVD